jgi:hypothetical protein
VSNTCGSVLELRKNGVVENFSQGRCQIDYPTFSHGLRSANRWENGLSQAYDWGLKTVLQYICWQKAMIKDIP